MKAAAAAAAAKDADAVESWFYDEYAGSAQVLRRDGSSELVPATDEGGDGDDPYAANEEEDEALFGSTDFEAMMQAADKRPPGLPFVCLDLSACTAIADAGLIHVARVSPQLQQLRLQLCDQVRHNRAMGAAGEGWMVVCLTPGRYSPCLCLHTQAAITSSAIAAFGVYCPNLSTVDLTGCSQIQSHAVQALVMGCHNLQCLLLVRGAAALYTLHASHHCCSS